MLETFPSGDRLLVGRDISDLDSFTNQIKTAVISSIALMFVVAGVARVMVTRRTVGRIESINAASRAIISAVSTSVSRSAAAMTNGIVSRRTST
jgi:hypothetical protein